MTENWISVNDKLPAMFKDVLVISKMNRYCITCVDASGEFDDYHLLNDEDNYAYWMPLPEPPKQ